MSSQLLLEPFLNCDLGTGAWEIAEAPLGSCTMQAGTSTSPCPLLHCSHIPFPSALTCAGCWAVSTLSGTRALCVSSRGLEAEWKAAYLFPERGPVRGSEVGLAGFSFPGQLRVLLNGSRVWVRLGGGHEAAGFGSSRMNALLGTFPPWGRQAYRLLQGALSFLLLQKKFYGPQRRKMMFMGFVRLGVWYNFFRARNRGFSGNLEGEGFILGGVFVVGSGKQVNSSCSRVDLWMSVGTRPQCGE